MIHREVVVGNLGEWRDFKSMVQQSKKTKFFLILEYDTVDHNIILYNNMLKPTKFPQSVCNTEFKNAIQLFWLLEEMVKRSQ